MAETYLQKLQREHKERRKKFFKPNNPPIRIATNFDDPDPVDRKETTFKDIFRSVCQFYKVSMLDVISTRRSIRIVMARHMTVYIASQHTLLSHSAIASRLARDRSTITSAIMRIETLLKNDKIMEDLKTLKSRLGL